MNRIKYNFLFVKFVLSLVVEYIPINIAYKKNNMKKVHALAWHTQQLYADWAFEGTNSSIEIKGKEKIKEDEIYLLVSNHSGIMDIAAIFKVFPKPLAYISKKEIKKIPIFSGFMRCMGCIFLDRENIRESVKEMAKGSETIKRGTSIGIFPEGTRSVTGEIGEFKKGSFKLAISNNVKILPMVLVGTRSMYEDNNNKGTTGSVKVSVLDPIDPSKLSKEEINNIHNIVRDIVKEEYEKMI